MAVRNYSSTAVETTLASAATDSEATLAVASATGFPAVPFVLCVDAGAVNQELVLVTGIAGTNLTVTRGYDSTVATAHEIGAVVQHSHAAVDFREANSHVNATAAHGTTGAVVGTTDTQTLTNKTLVDPTIDGTENVGGAWTAWVPTWTNVTVGNGVVVARYTVVGKTVQFVLQLTAGTTTSAATGATVTLPAAPVGVSPAFHGVTDVGSGVNVYPTSLVCTSGTTCKVLREKVVTDSVRLDDDNALVNGVRWFFSGTYEIA